MSKYTTEVRYICEHAVGLTDSVGYKSVNDVVAEARTKVFDFTYPIYDEAYRPVLETKILKHFYTREIGAETVGLWKLWLDTRMNEIMPYYNQLYKSAMLDFNPLYDVDVITEGGRQGIIDSKTDSKSNSESNVKYDGDNWNEYSDTPQGGLDGIATHTYLTDATHNTTDDNTHTTGEVTGTVKGDTNTTENYIERVRGKRGGITYSKMIEEYRKILLNIDMMIINDLNDLFFNLW